MVVTADGREWGELTTEIRTNEVAFWVHGPIVPRIWRVWGCSEGKEPILIGVPEPDGKEMMLHRSLSKQFLKNCGYWPNLPQWYVAGEQYLHGAAPDRKASHDGITQRRWGEYLCLSCPFDPQHEFPLAYAFTVCTVREGRAEFWTNEKTGRPLIGRPEELTN
ncbi:MAG: hypothetical protein ACI4PM_05485 [Butyricicoccus sp.]